MPLIWSAVAEGGTTAATAFRRAGRRSKASWFPKAGAGGLSLAGLVSECHETHESGSFDARLRRASAQPQSKFADALSQQDMECGRGGRNDRSYRFQSCWTVLGGLMISEGWAFAERAGYPNATRLTKAAAPMQACAVHLRSRIDSLRSPYGLLSVVYLRFASVPNFALGARQSQAKGSL